jgi:hypothetical protein
VSAGGIKIRKLTLCLYPASFFYRQTSGDTRQETGKKDRKADKQFMNIKKEKTLEMKNVYLFIANEGRKKGRRREKKANEVR